VSRAEHPALVRYRTHAERLGRRYQDLSAERVLRPVAAYLPPPPSDILDVGAGSGCDAAWLATQGHRVTAVEPVDELARQARALPGAERVAWVADHLPDLAKLRDRPCGFDVCLVSGVWHHLSATDRPVALARIAALLRPGGRLILSLRLGGEVDGTTIFAVDTGETLALADAAGLILLHRAATPSDTPAGAAAGISREWLVLQRPAGGAT
jgi:SAM-dependent methyltransferase